MKILIAIIMLVIAGCGNNERNNRVFNDEGRQANVATTEAPSPEPTEIPTPIPTDNEFDTLYLPSGVFEINYGETGGDRELYTYYSVESKDENGSNRIIAQLFQGVLIVDGNFKNRVKKKP
jgi:hypothetical protein